MGRYSLIISANGKDLVIKIKEYDEKSKQVINKDKVDLATIDQFTTCFSSQLECNRSYAFSDSAQLYISYQSKGQTKKIPCVFGNNRLICHVSNIVARQSDKSGMSENDPYFKELARNFLMEICYTSYRNFVLSDPRINLYIKNKIQDYMKRNANDSFFAEKIIKELQSYKNLRSIILNMQEYEKIRNRPLINLYIPKMEEVIIPGVVEVSRFIPSEEMEEPLFPPNSEEEREYKKYLDSLPEEDNSLEESYQLRKMRK